MNNIFNQIGDNFVFVIGIICYTVYQIAKLNKKPANRFEELKTLHELKEKGVITADDFEAKKSELLD